MVKIKDNKTNYLTPKEMEMSREDVDLQICLGIQSCKSKGAVFELLSDVRKHEQSLHSIAEHNLHKLLHKLLKDNDKLVEDNSKLIKENSDLLRDIDCYMYEIDRLDKLRVKKNKKDGFKSSLAIFARFIGIHR